MKWRILSLFLMVAVFLSGCHRASTPSIVEAPSLTSTPVLPTSTSLPSPTATDTPLPLVTQKGPYLIMTGDPATLKVCWQFLATRDVVLDWGTDGSYSAGSYSFPASQSGDPTCGTLTGLLSGTHYYYRLSSMGAALAGSFTTPPAGDATDLTFWGYGDTQAHPEIHDEIDGSILKEMGNDPSLQTFVFDAGDIMDNASEESLQENEFDPQRQNVVTLSSRVPLVNIMGNHDGTKLFLQYYPYPYTQSFDWSFDYGPAHFVVIDLYSNTSEDSPRWQWLKDDLSASAKKWKFILLHEPGWSAGPHENNEVVQKIIHPLAVRYGVAIVFSGHNHYYAHAQVDGVTYITTGGGGGDLYDPEHGWPNVLKAIKAYHYLRVQIAGDELTLTVFSPAGVQLDQFQINK